MALERHRDALPSLGRERTGDGLRGFGSANTASRAREGHPRSATSRASLRTDGANLIGHCLVFHVCRHTACLRHFTSAPHPSPLPALRGEGIGTHLTSPPAERIGKDAPRLAAGRNRSMRAIGFLVLTGALTVAWGRGSVVASSVRALAGAGGGVRHRDARLRTARAAPFAGPCARDPARSGPAAHRLHRGRPGGRGAGHVADRQDGVDRRGPDRIGDGADHVSARARERAPRPRAADTPPRRPLRRFHDGDPDDRHQGSSSTRRSNISTIRARPTQSCWRLWLRRGSRSATRPGAARSTSALARR